MTHDEFKSALMMIGFQPIGLDTLLLDRQGVKVSVNLITRVSIGYSDEHGSHQSQPVSMESAIPMLESLLLPEQGL